MAINLEEIVRSAGHLGRLHRDLQKGDIPKENYREIVNELNYLSKEIEREDPKFAKLLSEIAIVCKTEEREPCLRML